MDEVHSDWGDWLPRAVEAADPDGLRLWYLGCNGFVLKSAGGTTVYIDPYLGTGDPPRTIRMIPVPFDPEDVTAADAVLATHEHSDHVHGPSQAPILAQTGANFYATDPSLAVTDEQDWTTNWDVDAEQLTAVSPGDTFSVGDLTVSVESANDPDADGEVAYVIEHDAGTFVHGGDARPGSFESIGESYDVDLAVLAVGSVGMIPDKETREPKLTKWYNDENMIIEAATELQADRLVPTHWDMWKRLTADPTALVEHARSFEYPRHVEIAEIGDTVDLSR
ncbi:MBL fold metallo-hydrolase [Halovenus salina]|uniref:MBL fold metallo-hydrolase n=1 Tax=Halovenus salina TaxID=1510225 RepID=UPI00226098D3|nr:MBL fold metallo-hydrolase [Halovenus salina]